MKKKGLLLAGVALSAALVLPGCQGANTSKALSEIQEKYPPVIQNEGTPVDDATLKVAIVTDSAIKGIFNPYFYTDGIDDYVMKYTMMGAMATDSEYRLILDNDKTPINIHIDNENKTVTYKINPNFKWNDGSPVTTDDIIKTYEICANQEFIQSSQSPRFTGQMRSIEGIVEYNEGKAKTISGLEKISDSEMKIHFKEMSPSIAYGTEVTIGEFVNAKDMEGIPMSKVMESDPFRKNPKSYGPYYITNIVSGQSVTFEANPYYYKGAPKIKKVVIEKLPTSQQVADMQHGGHDLYLAAQGDAFEQMQGLKNIKIASRPELYMSYIGYKQGKWDAETNTVVTDPKAKMNNPALKKAIAMAIDNDMLGKKFYTGLRFAASTPIAPQFAKLRSSEVKGIYYDMAEAKKLLDDAGYKDVDGDGFREDPDGKPLEIHLAMMSGSEVQEPISKYYLQQWGKGESGDGKDGLGLNVKLVDDRLLDFHVFYDRLMNDDPGIDMFAAAFGLSSNPNPSGLFGKHEQFNLWRYTSAPLQDTLDKINSPEALDPKKNEEFYHEFEKVVAEEVPMAPQQFRVEILPVNNRVKYYDLTSDWNKDFDWSKLELTATEPAK